MDKANSLKPNEIPRWVLDSKNRAKTYTTNNKIPTRRSENWKYTDLSILKEQNFFNIGNTELPFHSFDKEFSSLDNEVSIPTLNGRFDTNTFSSEKVPDGLIIRDLKDALWSKKEEIIETTGKFSSIEDEYFNQLNQSFLGEGVYIEVEEGFKIEPIIHIKHLFSSFDKPFATYPRIYLKIKKEGSITLLESKKSDAKSCYFTNSASFISLDKDAKLNHYELDDVNDQAFHIHSHYFNIENGGNLKRLALSKGAKIFRNNYNIQLKGADSSASLEDLAILSGSRHLDNFSKINHDGKKTESYQKFKSILFENGKYAYEGNIKVTKDASETKANQINRNLLIGDNAEVNVKPWLLIDNDNIECSHGSSTGQCDNEQLFYLMSRGLSFEKAQGLICKGFAKDMLIDIKEPKVGTYLNESIDNALTPIE